MVRKTEIRNLLPDLRAPQGYVGDKVEGLAIDAGHFIVGMAAMGGVFAALD